MGRRKRGDPVHGWVNLHKPLNLGSTDAVTRVRRLFNAQKAGHAGTLDPLATGVLPVALGEATKTVPFVQDGSKSYRFTVAWGATTATLDREGAVVAESARRPSPAEVEAALPALTGEISQVPPAYSAIRVDGERAYDLARAGETVEIAARTVTVHALRVADAPDADHVVLEADCGKGTYVRALARDLAAALGAEAHVAELIRTRVGPFTLADAIPLESLGEMGYERAASEGLLPVETALDDIPALAVTREDAFRLSQGRAIVLLPRQVEALRSELGLETDAGASRIVSAMEGARVVALGELKAGRVEPVRVFNL